ncbi:MAG TPA: sigma-70 family RNA polymerase sigma factor [Acidimicrobiales bacterium]|nr:sigma-70 family RNA polymerase sigma factor [Acidimicrobiales bacterium]
MTVRDWDELFRLHAPRLRRVIARRVHADAVDDVLQDTFLRAYRSRATIDVDRPIGPWLTTIAVRAAMARRQADSAAPVCHPDDATAEEPYEAMRTRARGRVVAAALRAVNPRHRRLLHAVALEGVSQVDLARREGLAPEAVRAAVLRARRRFRLEYERLWRESGLAGVLPLRPAVTRLRARLGRTELFVPTHAEVLFGLAAVAAFAGAGGMLPNAQGIASADSTEAESPAAGGGVEASPAREPTAATGSPERPRRHPPTAVDEVERQVAAASGGSGLAMPPRAWTVRSDALGAEATVGGTEKERRRTVDVDGPLGQELTWGHDSTTYCGTGRVSTATCTVLDVLEPAHDAALDAAEPD